MPHLPKEPNRPWRNKREPREDPRNKEHDKFYDSPAWRRLRKVVLSEEPLCRQCKEEGRITPAKIVDHIIQRKKRPELSLERSNLQPLCGRCHAIKSAKESKQ